MRQKLPQTVRWLLCCLALTIFEISNAQTLNTPELSFSYACVSDSFNTFNAIISYENNPFNSDNVFHLEMSDASGSFDNPSLLKSITGENFSFDFETSFSLPENVAGENYRIRVRSTSPEKISPATTPFNAYYVPNVNLVLNGYQDVAICGGQSATISLNLDVAPTYLWYKNGVFFQEGGSSLEITSSGEYYAEGFYGDCTGALHSNIVIVNFGEEINARIDSEPVVEACPGTTHQIKAVTDNEFLDYKWFKDDVELTELPNYLPVLDITMSAETYGVYKLSLVNEGGCEAFSQEVEIRQPSTETIVTAVSPLESILIEGNSLILRVETNTADPRVSWFKDEEMIVNGNSLELEVSEIGTYRAMVSAPGSCMGVVESPPFKVFEPVSFTAEIDHLNNYEACSSIRTTLGVSSLIATANNGLEHEIDTAQFNLFSFNWYKNEEALNNNQPKQIVENYSQNGAYTLKGEMNGIEFTSNTMQIKLGLPEFELTSDTDVVCSNNGEATLSATVFENATYNWYRDGQLFQSGDAPTVTVNQSGVFTAELMIDGCSSASNEVSIETFGEELVSVFPSQHIIITANAGKLVSASGGDSYLWKNTDGLVLSSSDSFNASEEGTYYLVAIKDGCEVIKEITVEISEVVEVPNIISPNQDNINDKWVLPAQFANDPDVEVTICDTYGKPVLKTKAYQNNWPENSTTDKSEASIYYYFIQKNGKAVKKGSITVVNR